MRGLNRLFNQGHEPYELVRPHAIAEVLLLVEPLLRVEDRGAVADVGRHRAADTPARRPDFGSQELQRVRDATVLTQGQEPLDFHPDARQAAAAALGGRSLLRRQKVIFH